ncbi:phosphotransferase enzyme family protein [Penicillium malachiteum]|uniref:phosphotransferase enzyme family protein n=1 Tax=Penicillium malachiteum TaxID=1324776 RepID=UPI002546AFF6|nr:phosphotransferase enzyme family protein [Penicillium malachiteum]KAJ5730754.1 phosphotransferase enzyme family protein [Penicillium malachiteum]
MTLKDALFRMILASSASYRGHQIPFLEHWISNEKYDEAIQKGKVRKASLIAIGEEDEEDGLEDLALLEKDWPL